MNPNRRTFLKTIPMVLLGYYLKPFSVFGPESGDPMLADFKRWLVTNTSNSDICPYFVQSNQRFLSPVTSAKVILFWLKMNEPEQAISIADALLACQKESWNTSYSPLVHGALPSEIRLDGSVLKPRQRSDRYYSGDNLVILEALICLYERTQITKYLDGAEHIARWLTDVMGDGHHSGLLADDVGSLMHFVKANGDIENNMHTGMEQLWLYGLKRFAKLPRSNSLLGITPRPMGTIKGRYIDQSTEAVKDRCLKLYNRSVAFFALGQYSEGGWYDHYEPGWPAHKYDPKGWKFQSKAWGKDVVIGDNELRAALGAWRNGNVAGVRRFASWFQTENGGVPAYLDAHTCKRSFVASDKVYYDVVASGLWQALATYLELGQAQQSAHDFLKRSQNRDGAWYWDIDAKTFQSSRKEEAIITSLWASTNIIPNP